MANNTLGELLISEQLITAAQFENALSKQRAQGGKIGKILVDLGYLNEKALCQMLARQLQVPYIELAQYTLNPTAIRKLSEAQARRYKALILEDTGTDYLVGMVDPQDIIACDDLARLLKRPIRYALVREFDLVKTFDRAYRRMEEITGFAEELSEELKGKDYDIAQLTVGLAAADAPVVKLLQSIFEDAVQVNASDIHIEPDENVLRIRQRVDGVLQEHIVKEKRIASALTLRLKLMASLNIAEKRLPQDGRFSIKIKGKNYDVRLATLPVQFGESVVMRLLNQSSEKLDLSQIGMPEPLLIRLRKIIHMPHGMLLVTGPTGSGKTTTLYGALSELNKPENKIITVEDPVEYRMARINQVQVNPKVDLTFATVLRAILRQDPNIIMVGEIRDTETAAIALRAAMTGHFVLATMHTNDAISSTIRLIDMGAEGYLVATALRAVIAQRLIRLICQNCTASYSANAQQLAWLQTFNAIHPLPTIFQYGAGCSHCNNTGYHGQIGVFELLELNTEMIEALRHNDTMQFERCAKQSKSYKPLRYIALDLAIQGQTTLDEVLRIAGEIEEA